MSLTRTIRYQAASAVALTGVALILAACGGSSSSSTTSSAASASPSGSASNAAGTAVGTAKGSLGTYLTGGSGRALYIWVADTKNKSSCSGACAAAWPPLTTNAAPSASGGTVAAELGTITRSDGSKQVTYLGRPLYYYAGDSGPGMTSGNGSDQFGAKWWLISPSGGQVGASTSANSASSGGTSSGSSASTSSGSSDSSGGSGWG